jgi:hypothetical protein
MSKPQITADTYHNSRGIGFNYRVEGLKSLDQMNAMLATIDEALRRYVGEQGHKIIDERPPALKTDLVLPS